MRTISINDRRLESAIAVCIESKTPAARNNLRLLRRLQKMPGESASRIACAVRCGRSHVFNVVAWVNSGDFHRLSRPGKFRKRRLLTTKQRIELARKLGGEFKSAQDVLDWYGKGASRAVVYAWCSDLGFLFRRARSARKSTAPPPTGVGRRNPKRLTLTK